MTSINLPKIHNSRSHLGRLLVLFYLFLVCGVCNNRLYAESDELETQFRWRYTSPTGSCEICAFDNTTQQIFVTVGGGIDVLSAASGVRGSTLEQPRGFHATSVACSQGRLAVAWASIDKTERGQLKIYDTETLSELGTFTAGYLPDMVAFSPDGRYLLSANEGEPTSDYSFDPPASITVVDLKQGIASAQVVEANFKSFNPFRSELRRDGIRLCGPSKTHADGQATVSEDLEPEYLSFAPDSRRAWITLQENNAIAELDLEQATIVRLHPLGCKDFGKAANPHSKSATTGLDASDQDGGSRILPWPVLGLFQPDGICSFHHAGAIYLLTANEGDPRDYQGYREAQPAATIATSDGQVDPKFVANEVLNPDRLGRLEVASISKNKDKGGHLEKLYCFGARSFAIWQVIDQDTLQLVYESGNDFERIVSQQFPERFNANSKPDSPPDVRSTSRGPEPEGIVVGQVGEHRLAMIGLERTGGVMLYDVSEPRSPSFVCYLPPLDKDGVMDCAPEGLLFIAAEKSPTGKAILVVCNERSGTTTAYELYWKSD